MHKPWLYHITGITGYQVVAQRIEKHGRSREIREAQATEVDDLVAMASTTAEDLRLAEPEVPRRRLLNPTLLS